MAFLEVNNIHKHFGTKADVLKGVSFELEEGEVLSIIGSSGNGKTTLLRCLNFLEIADQGTITLNGEEIFRGGAGKIDGKTLRENRLHLGLVFQSFNLFPQYTAFGNVKLPLELMEKERKKRGLPSLLADGDIDATVSEILSKVGLSDKMHFYPWQLSGGQCQRVAIARAMALKPDVLCFDEPTSALDPELTGEVLKVIRELKQTSGITMIIVTHEMAFAKSISDKVLFMANGKVEEIGTPEQIFEHPQSEKTRAFVAGYN